MVSEEKVLHVASGRRRAFRIVAGLLGVLVLALSLPFTVISFVDDAESIHRMHNLAFTALYTLLLGIGLLASARNPEQHVSAFLVAAGSGVAGSIAGLASGDFISGIWFTAPVSIVALWVLHPSRSVLARPDGVDVPTAVLSVAALGPAVAFLLTQAALQRDGFAADPHWEFHHYSAMGATALALAVCGLAASLRATGRALGAVLVGLSGILVGGGSLLVSDHVGSLEPVWSWLTLVWGIAVVVVARPLRGSSAA